MRKLLIGLFIILLAGCATSQRYQEILTSWHGADMEQIINVWGYPDREMVAPNGNKVYVYAWAKTAQLPAQYTPGTTSVTTRNGNTTVTSTPSTYLPGETIELECTTWFEVNANNIIIKSSFRGNNCIASESQAKRLMRMN